MIPSRYTPVLLMLVLLAACAAPDSIPEVTDTSLPPTQTPDPTATPTPLPTATYTPEPTLTPTPTGPFDGLEQGLITEGAAVGLSLGSLDAPLTLVEYGDFACPHCNDLSMLIIEQIVRDYVRSGELRVVFKPMFFIYPPYSTAAAAAVLCAAPVNLGWEMTEALWDIAERQGAGVFTVERVVSVAGDLEMNENAFETCLYSTETEEMLIGLYEEAIAIGLNAVPAMFLNGEQVIYRGEQYAYNDIAVAIRSAGQ